ncbi:polysaccharide biosynthesis/export family protein [Candidatus Magnetominusculus xianensis]|uniref:Polysaccharide biosynthesis protein n=1 Tax=Candidatus Magnetominusculus xianensis TaxID=1748249 RepID=A0ABR5SDG6_9BACT|nr:polysaccharide biosynthesis/export family protein [Candidatus Magnetominusculus xianensis]KWT82982.1 polysaccharide biosynthesis protein [Candidatus Magnetominusculus xianensis]MBF0403061.1 polysaccharide biosynthesis/export family protein [Nitrospirota bacterium]
MDRLTQTLKWFKNKRVSLFVCLFLLTLAAGCASVGSRGQSEIEGDIVFENRYDNDTAFNTSYDVFPEYRVMPGDILEVFYKVETGIAQQFKIEIDYTVMVKFVHAPELNETQTVRPDGTITLPYIGKLYVMGKTTDALTAELKQFYSKILKEPNLYITVPEFRSTLKEFKADLHTAPRGLSRLVTVRPDGVVTFPIVGDVFAAKKTLREINVGLNAEYEKIIPGLHVNLFLEKQSGFLVYVFGEVKKPGAFPVIKPISLLEALALSESFLPTAKTGNIIVLRKTKEKIVATAVDLTDVLSTQSRASLMMLNPDDVVYVPRRTLSKMADIAKDISDITFFRGWALGGSFGWNMYNAPSTSRTDQQTATSQSSSITDPTTGQTVTTSTTTVK